MARARKDREGRARTDSRRQTVPPQVQDTGWPVMPTIKDAYALALQYQFEESEWWPEERLQFHQLHRLEHVINHAARTVPFYRKRLAQVAGKRHGTLTIEDFRQLPVLRRQDIQDAGDAFVSSEFPASHGRQFVGQTSGSTGRPVTFRGTDVTDLFTTAVGLRADLWHKRDFSVKMVSIITAKKANDQARKWSAVPSTGPLIRLDLARPINELFDAVLREAPGYLITHPNALMAMIERSQQLGRAPQGLLAALTFGERVEPELREAVRNVWKADVTDSYSATEFGPIAVQCPETTKLHVMSENVLLEVLNDDERPCQPGEVGRAVVTSLHNFATPFIRYELGDHVALGEACPCGRGLPVIEQVIGRERELVVYPSGDRQFPEARLHTLRPELPIKQFQLTQRTVESIEVKLAVSRPLTNAEEEIVRSTLTDRLRYAFRFEFIYVDEIPRAPNGKYFQYISDIK